MWPFFADALYDSGKRKWQCRTFFFVSFDLANSLSPCACMSACVCLWECELNFFSFKIPFAKFFFYLIFNAITDHEWQYNGVNESKISQNFWFDSSNTRLRKWSFSDLIYFRHPDIWYIRSNENIAKVKTWSFFIEYSPLFLANFFHESNEQVHLVWNVHVAFNRAPLLSFHFYLESICKKQRQKNTKLKLSTITKYFCLQGRRTHLLLRSMSARARALAVERAVDSQAYRRSIQTKHNIIVTICMHSTNETTTTTKIDIKTSFDS